jgi:hypothetical protein
MADAILVSQIDLLVRVFVAPLEREHELAISERFRGGGRTEVGAHIERILPICRFPCRHVVLPPGPQIYRLVLPAVLEAIGVEPFETDGALLSIELDGEPASPLACCSRGPSLPVCWR